MAAEITQEVGDSRAFYYRPAENPNVVIAKKQRKNKNKIKIYLYL